jgi:hypothetical protein
LVIIEKDTRRTEASGMRFLPQLLGISLRDEMRSNDIRKKKLER